MRLNSHTIQLRAFDQVVSNIKAVFPFQTRYKYLAAIKHARLFRVQITKKILSDREYFSLLERYLATLSDSHTKLGAYPSKRFYAPRGLSVSYTSQQYQLYRNEKKLGTIRSIDGQTPKLIITEQLKRFGGSTLRHRQNRALMFVLASQDRRPVQIVYSMGSKTRRLSVSRVQLKEGKSGPAAWKFLPRQLGYIRIAEWRESPQLKRAYNQLLLAWNSKRLHGLIFDVRGNRGGSAKVAQRFAQHFFRHPVGFGSFLTRVSTRSLRLKRRKLVLHPVEPFINIPIAVLVDSWCFSSNEYFIAGLKDNGRAVLAGETTGGGSGNPKRFRIPYGQGEFELDVSTWRFYRKNGRLLEGRGIEPDFVIKEAVQQFHQ